jgi:hypothetical protein
LLVHKLHDIHFLKDNNLFETNFTVKLILFLFQID